jgi:hypothetical protein
MKAEQTLSGSHIERRRSPRLLLDVPLVVHGISSEGRTFQEETFTISVSEHGALFVLAAKLQVGQMVVLINPQTQLKKEGRVARFGSAYGGLAQVGVEFPRPAPEFWPIGNQQPSGPQS